MIALHCGVGRYDYDQSKMKEYKSCIKKICDRGIQLLQDGSNSIDICTAIISDLEDCKFTNAGYSSCLTDSGIIELEASIMEGSGGLFGGVSCVRNIKNPIMIARDLLLDQRSLNNIFQSPQYLSGEGAQKYALSKGITSIDENDLVSAQSLKNFHSCQKLLQANNESVIFNKLDTVGAICIDIHNEMAVAASSGGIIYRKEGRVGHVSLPCGSGVWIDQNPLIATCTTGLGEILAREIVARRICDALKVSLLNNSEIISPIVDVVHEITKNPRNTKTVCHIGGLSVIGGHEEERRLIGFNSSWNMMMSYASKTSSKSKVSMIKGPDVPGSCCAVQELIL